MPIVRELGKQRTTSHLACLPLGVLGSPRLPRLDSTQDRIPAWYEPIPLMGMSHARASPMHEQLDFASLNLGTQSQAPAPCMFLTPGGEPSVGSN